MKIKEITYHGENVFILLDGEANIKEGSQVKDENGNVFHINAVMSICTGCTMCSDTMLNAKLVENKSEIGKEIVGGQL